MTDRVVLQVTNGDRYSFSRQDFEVLEVTDLHEVWVMILDHDFQLAVCDSAEEAREVERRILRDIWSQEGYAVIDLDKHVASHLEYLRSTCPICGGSGEVYRPDLTPKTCPYCGGTGRDETP